MVHQQFFPKNTLQASSPQKRSSPSQLTVAKKIKIKANNSPPKKYSRTICQKAISPQTIHCRASCPQKKSPQENFPILSVVNCLW
jgi:hypothetical protein